MQLHLAQFHRKTSQGNRIICILCTVLYSNEIPELDPEGAAGQTHQHEVLTGREERRLKRNCCWRGQVLGHDSIIHLTRNTSVFPVQAVSSFISILAPIMKFHPKLFTLQQYIASDHLSCYLIISTCIRGPTQTSDQLLINLSEKGGMVRSTQDLLSCWSSRLGLHPGLLGGN